MKNHELLKRLVLDAILDLGGRASILEVSKWIWENRQKEISQTEKLFFTWQYGMRWAAQDLRKEGNLKKIINKNSGVWEISEQVFLAKN